MVRVSGSCNFPTLCAHFLISKAKLYRNGYIHMYVRTYRQTDRQTDRQTINKNGSHVALTKLVTLLDYREPLPQTGRRNTSFFVQIYPHPGIHWTRCHRQSWTGTNRSRGCQSSLCKTRSITLYREIFKPRGGWGGVTFFALYHQLANFKLGEIFFYQAFW